MHFTYSPAFSLIRRTERNHHICTDINLSSTTAAWRIRCAYRQLRNLGLQPVDARQVIWDLLLAGQEGLTLSDHDLRYS